MNTSPNSNHGSDSVTIALHFQHIMRGELLSDTDVEVKLLKRTLVELLPMLPIIGSVLIRTGKLFYTQDLGGDLESSWRESIGKVNSQAHILKSKQFDVNSFPLDRIFVIALSGNLACSLMPLYQRLRRFRNHKLLFGMQIDAGERSQDIVYLRSTSAIGSINKLGHFELGFDAIEYVDEIPGMLDKIGVESSLSHAALNNSLKLLD